MNYADWIVIAYFVLNTLQYISRIGKPRDREPIKAEEATVEILIVLIVTFLVLVSH